LVNTSPSLIDVACAFAWVQFIRRQPDRDRNWRAWMVTVVEREAWRLHSGESRATSLTVDSSDGLVVWDRADPRDRTGERLELREALEMMRRIPERRREVAFLKAIGLRRREIGEILGLSETRVDHLGREATAWLRREREIMEQPRTPRAVRLRELESSPPKWLVSSIGRPPGLHVGMGGLLAWRRAALAVEDESGYVGAGARAVAGDHSEPQVQARRGNSE
jgi:DNA-directed RNA polymerase specialized sigma24 family protein